MPKTCDLKDPVSAKPCGAPAMWIADVGWGEGDEASPYTGTSWSMALCPQHYQQLLDAGRITGTAHQA